LAARGQLEGKFFFGLGRLGVDRCQLKENSFFRFGLEEEAAWRLEEGFLIGLAWTLLYASHRRKVNIYYIYFRTI